MSDYDARKRKSTLTSFFTIKMVDFGVIGFCLVRGVLLRFFHLEIT
jgi:hypothetical protein